MSNKISKKILREFGILIGFGFPIFLGWLVPTLTGHQFRIWTLWVSAIGFIFGLLAPRILYLPYLLWLKLGYILGWINSRIILGLIFIFVLIPIGLVMKFFGYDPLKIRSPRNITYKHSRKNHTINLNRIF